VAAIHSGLESAANMGIDNANQARSMIAGTSGIDAVICGHSHSAFADYVNNKDGVPVAVVNPANNGSRVSQLKFDLSIASDGTITVNSITPANILMTDANGYGPDQVLSAMMVPYQTATLAFSQEIIGQAGESFSVPSSYKEPSALIDLIHSAEMAIPGVDISIASRHSTVTFAKGPIQRGQSDALYEYESALYVIKMTGESVKRWMERAADYYGQSGGSATSRYADPLSTDCWDSPMIDMLYGMTYDIDITEPYGQNQRIKNLRYKGKRVRPTDTFNVAVRTYRFGSDYMTKAGMMPNDESVLLWNSLEERGVKGGLMKGILADYIKEQGVIYPEIKSDWTLSLTTIAETSDVILDKNTLKLTSSEVAQLSIINYKDKLVWSSSNESVAVVNSNGVVTGKSDGIADIKASSIDGRAYDTCQVTVSSDDSIIGCNAANVFGVFALLAAILMVSRSNYYFNTFNFEIN